jgi:hypothetical protein
MIFSVDGTFEKVKGLCKFVTRRPIKKEDEFEHEKGKILRVIRGGRLLWEVGKDYAVQPGRGKEGEGRMRILHLEVDPNPGNLSYLEAILEGFEHPDQFREVWKAMYGEEALRHPAWRIRFAYIPEGWKFDVETGSFCLIDE